MKKTLTYSFIISFLFYQTTIAQEDTKETTYKQRYGLRVGMDVSKPIRSFLQKGYSGLEFVGDYRWNYNYYLAAEVGFENRSKNEDFFSYKTTGQFIRLGIDYNAYNNWYGMENMIYMGGRYAFSRFAQELTSYMIYTTNPYWEENTTGNNPNWLRSYEGRTAHWLEVILGMKVELFTNLFAGASLRLGVMIANPTDSFPNYWIPGFNRVREGSRFGANFNYTITYLIPLYKKEKEKKKTDKSTTQ